MDDVTKKERARKWMWRLTNVTVAGLTGAVAVVLFWLLNPQPIIEATQPTTDKAVYHPGGPVTLNYESFCVTSSKDILVQRVAVNEDTGQRLFLLPYGFGAEDVPATCYTDLKPTIPLPAEMSSGQWRIEVSITYGASPVRDLTQTFVTPVFTVKPPHPVDTP